MPMQGCRADFDLIDRVYEYCIGEFASAEGKRGGEFCTPKSVVETLVEMIEPTRGRVYDPCFGTGGFFVQSERFIDHHQGQSADISIFGQERNHTTCRLARMNLAIRGIFADIRWNQEGAEARRLPRRALRLRPRQPAVQHLRLGWRRLARGRALAVRRAAGRHGPPWRDGE